MPGNVSLSRKQERFLQALVLGASIVGAAKQTGIAERTGHRWLADSLVQAELERLRTAAREAEEREIERIMTTGYAAVHERVKGLDAMARLLEKSWYDPERSEKIVFQWLTPDKVREWRGCLDDIARELGERVKQVKQENTNPDIVGAADSLFNKLAAFQQKKQHDQTQP